MDDRQKLQHVLDLTRDAINEGNRPLAFEHLRSIQFEIEDVVGTSAWAEHQLLYADALKLPPFDPEAHGEFEKAIERASNLATPDRHLEMRAHADYAKYLDFFPLKRSVAREHNQRARELAIQCGLPEESARFHLRLIKIDLLINGDPRIAAFRNFKQAAKKLGATAQEQLRVWFQYWGDTEEQGVGLQAARARGEVGVEYFEGLLRAIMIANATQAQ